MSSGHRLRRAVMIAIALALAPMAAGMAEANSGSRDGHYGSPGR